jgi:hypothetical protein
MRFLQCLLGEGALFQRATFLSPRPIAANKSKIQLNQPVIDTTQSQNRASSSLETALTIRVARTLEEVEEIRGIWSAWETHRDGNIDISLESVWTAEEFIRPHVIVIYRNGQPDAMLPGRLERVRVTPRVGYLKLPGIRARQITFPKGGVLGNASAENSEEFIKSIQEALRVGEADMAMLHQVQTDTDLYSKALGLSGFATRDHQLRPLVRNSMKLSPNVEQIYQALSSGLRADLRKKKRKLAEVFGDGAKIRCVRDSAELGQAMIEMEAVAAKTYQRGLGVGFENSRLTRERLHLYARKGWLRVFLLTVNEKPCAFWMGTVFNGSFCSDYLGFDPAFGKYSPGTVLIAAMIEEFCKEGVAEIDFGVGEGRYKDRFGNHRVMEASVCIFRPSLKGVGLNAAQTSTRFLEGSMRKILESTNLLPTLKKLWRKKLSVDDAEGGVQQ